MCHPAQTLCQWLSNTKGQQDYWYPEEHVVLVPPCCKDQDEKAAEKQAQNSNAEVRAKEITQEQKILKKKKEDCGFTFSSKHELN